MPIYAYRCESCGHAKDVLQRMSDSLLTTCPACGAESFRKQLTAAGFQLKGSGWYVTDFKGGPTADKADAAAASAAGAAKADAPKPGAGEPAAKPGGESTAPAPTKAEAGPPAAPAASGPAPAAP